MLHWDVFAVNIIQIVKFILFYQAASDKGMNQKTGIGICQLITSVISWEALLTE